MSCGPLSATFSNDVLREYHVFWGTKHAVMVQPVVGGVVVPLRRAATPRQTMASSCSCTFCWDLSAYSSVQKIPREGQAWHLQTTEPPVLHSSDKAGWLGEVGRQCLVTPIIQRYHQRPPLHSWHGFAKIQKHSEDQIPPLESSPPLLPRSSFPESVSFLHALAPRLCLALVCPKFTVNT